jgi:xanthine dehydrogenase YagS FAD-binding subunit
MKDFTLVRPRTLAEAVDLLPREKGRRVALLAGGQDLLPELKEHLLEPERVVNLKGLPGLDRIEWGADGALALGALVTLEDLERDARVQQALPLLAQAAASVGSPQIRAVGTVGGNLNQRPRCWYYRTEDAHCLKKGGTHCYAFSGRNRYNAILGGGPSYIVHPSDLAPPLVALGAEVVLAGPAGERRLLLEDYYVLPRQTDDQTVETVRAPDEILVSVRVPAPAPGMRGTWLKFRERHGYDWALSAVAAVAWLDDGRVREARLVLGGVAPRPWRCEAAERLLAGRALDAAACREAAQSALADARPLSDNGYKIPLTQALIVRALTSLES